MTKTRSVYQQFQDRALLPTFDVPEIYRFLYMIIKFWRSAKSDGPRNHETSSPGGRQSPDGTTQRKSPTRQSRAKTSLKPLIPQPSSSDANLSVKNRLLQAREFLHSEDPSTTPNFANQYRVIQSFIEHLPSAKQLFDIKVYNDVKAMLRVHGDRLDEHQRLLLLTRSMELPTSSSPSRLFTDDLAYEGPSSSSTTTSQNLPRHMSEDEQEHPWQEGELLTFEPRKFGSAGPGYRHPAPKEVMGFNPERGFVSRSIHSSEDEMFPGTESAKKRVMGKGFAQLDFSPKQASPLSKAVTRRGNRQGNDKSVSLTAKPMLQEEIAESTKNLAKGKRKASEVVYPSGSPSRKGKGKEKEIRYPDLSSEQASSTKPKVSPTKAITQAENMVSPALSMRQTPPENFPSTLSKRRHDKEYVDPITLANKRVKVQEAEPELVADETFQGYGYNGVADNDDPAYNTDDLEMQRVFEMGDSADEEELMTGNNKDNELAMPIEEAVNVRQTEMKVASEAEHAKIATPIRKKKSQKAAVTKSNVEKTTNSDLPSFATRFLGFLGVDRKPVDEGRRTGDQGLSGKNAVPSTSRGLATGAKIRLDDHSPLKEGKRKEVLKEDTAYVPLTSQPSPRLQKPPKSDIPKEIEKEVARKTETKTAKETNRKVEQPTSYKSPLPELAVVPATPSTSTFRAETEKGEAKRSDSKGSNPKPSKSYGSALSVPDAIPLTPPSTQSPEKSRQRGDEAARRETKEAQEKAEATLTQAASRYCAAEEAATKARKQRDAIIKEARANDLKATNSQAAKSDTTKAKRSKGKTPSAADSRLSVPPMTSPAPTTLSSEASAAHVSDPPSSGPYGHFGLIPPEIANAPITYPSSHSPSPPSIRGYGSNQGYNNIETTEESGNWQFHPGDPVFLFGETRYLAALKSRQIEKDLASNDPDVQAEIDRRPLFGMFARYRLPDPPVGWDKVVEGWAVEARDRKRKEREKVVKGRVQKSMKKGGSKKDKSTCIMS
ncbi:MAG: hypothetical protein Q9172_007286 [Xanthocarpia lactea]